MLLVGLTAAAAAADTVKHPPCTPAAAFFGQAFSLGLVAADTTKDTIKRSVFTLAAERRI